MCRHARKLLDGTSWLFHMHAFTALLAPLPTEPQPMPPTAPPHPCRPRFVDNWRDLEAPQNVRIASIPTVFDPSLAPPGKAVGKRRSRRTAAWGGMPGLTC